MAIWELTAHSTEERGEAAVRYREYTASAKRADRWVKIPRIPFTDSGHGIAFSARLHPRGTRRKRELKYRVQGACCLDHIEAHLPKLMAR